MPRHTLFAPTKGDGKMTPQQLAQAADLSRDTPSPAGRNVFTQGTGNAVAPGFPSGSSGASGNSSTPASGSSPSGSAGGDLGGAYPNPTVVSVGDVTSGILNPVNGGTGQSSTPTDGQLLIGNSATSLFSLARLSAGTNITITNGHGTITISASGGGGSTGPDTYTFFNGT